MKIKEIKLNGPELLNNSRLNKGTAFTEAERDVFALHGLLPPHVGNLEEQRTRRHNWLASITASLEKYSFMRDLQDTNETLFYSLITNHVEETYPQSIRPQWEKPARNSAKFGANRGACS